MDFVEYFYTEIHGYYPFDNDDAKIQCQKVIDYLNDCGIPNSSIIKVLEDSKEYDVLTFDILPEWLWDNSLLKKNTFYYHSLLHMLSKPPIWDPVTNKVQGSKFYIEMLINFTVQDVLSYFYNSFSIENDLKNSKRDEGSVLYLLNKYKFDFIEPIDFLLSLIDYTKSIDEEHRIANILDVSQYESIVYADLKAMTTEAKASKADHIVWR